MSRVLAFHLNDARAPLGSGLDRHEHIGRGHLGLPAFRLLLNDPRFATVPEGAGDAEGSRAPGRPAQSGDAAAAAPRQRDVVTPTRRQRALTGQVEHFGEIGMHTFWPKDTSRSL